MIIETRAQLESAKTNITEMKARESDEWISSVFGLMLRELEKGDVENICTPSYISIVKFGYDIFGSLLHR